MKLKKRLTALVLACFMVVSLLPTTAFAADETPECAEDEHVWVMGTILKHAYCEEGADNSTKTGIAKYTCSVCGKSEYRKSPVEHAKPTDAAQITTEPATCGEKGSVTYTCTRCETAITEETAATGQHDWKTGDDGVGYGYVDATCTENAKAGTVCSVCGATQGEMEEVPNTKLGHDHVDSTDPDEGYVAATCGQAGTSVKICSRCGDKVTETIPALEHNYQPEGEDSVIDATCTKANGVKEVCTHCGDEEITYWTEKTGDVYIAPTGHDWEKHEAVIATCEVAGVAAYWECNNCGLFFTGTLAEGATAPANDLAEGLSEAAPAADGKAEHTYAEGDAGTKKDVVPATCEVGESYKLVKTCTVCKQEIVVQTVTGDETGKDTNAHKKVLDGNPLKAATCTTTGIAKYKCEVCGKSLGYQSLEASHTYTETITKAATCTEAGEKTLTCSVCAEGTEGRTKTETIEALGHDYDGTIEANVTVTKEATCSEAGSKTVKCKNGCGTTETQAIPATQDHEWQEDYMVNPTCTEPTKIGTACKNCGTLKPGTEWSEFGQALEHDYQSSTDTTKGYVAATCTAGGMNIEVCSRCGEVSKSASVQLEHDYEETYQAADCTHAEGVLKACKNCDDEVFEAFDEAIGEAKKAHTWVQHEAVAATCKAAGMPEYWQCSQCKRYTESDPEGQGFDESSVSDTAPTPTAQEAHTFGDNPEEIKKNVIEADCTDDGSYDKYYHCTVCDKDILQDEPGVIPVDTNAHVPELVSTLKPATCTATGIGKYKCSKCEKDLGYKSIGTETAHDWVKDTAASTAATCEQDGADVYKCTKCTEGTKTETIPATGHDYSETPDATKSVAATCGKAGKDVYVCANGCDVDKEEEVEATGEHTYEEDVIDATCTEPEKVGQVCSVCGAEGVVTEVPGSKALGHDMQLDTANENYKKATCTEDGLDTKKCSRCDHTETETTTKLDHDWVDVEAVEATCDQAAGVKQTCQREGCGATQVIAFEGDLAEGATGKHTWVEHAAVAATCSAEGMPAYEQCSVCSKYKANDGSATETAPTATEKTAHTPGEAVREDVVNPSVDEVGNVVEGSYNEVTYCSVCGEKMSSVPKTIAHDENSHTWKDEPETELKKATCTTDGIGKYKCTACDATTYRTVKGGHVWDDGEVTKEATCGAAGEKTFTCVREGGCTDAATGTRTETIKATGEHELEDKTVAATCTSPAMTGKVCKNCDYKEEMKAVTGSKALGHDWVKDTSKDSVEGGNKAATCEGDGLQWYKCSRGDGCAATEAEPGTKSEVIQAKDHTPGEAEYVPATCTEGAKSVVKCTECQSVISTDDLSVLEPATGHANVETKLAVAGTCTAKAKTAGLFCNDCKKWVTGTAGSYELDADQTHEGDYDYTEAGHTYDNGKVTTEGKCAEDDADAVKEVKTYTCNECGEETEGHTKVVTAEKAPDHTWGEETESKAATCTKTGLKSATCSECGKVDAAIVIPAKGHDYDETVDVEATCQATGSKTYTCKREDCDEGEDEDGHGKTWTETIERKPHEYEEGYQDATCTKNAIAGQICKLCHEGKVNEDGSNDFMEVQNSALGHNWVKDEDSDQNKDATCTEAGKQAYKCSREDCDGTEENPGTKVETIAAKGHTSGKAEYIDATCTEGAKSVTKCTVCQNVIESVDLSELEPATGHANVVDKARVPATCKAKGHKAGKFCTDCNNWLKEQGGKYTVTDEGELEIDENAHVASITKTLKQPTCNTTGIGKAVCELCGADMSYVSIPATGDHTWGTADEEGKITCTVCGAEKPSEACEEHTLTTILGKPATCTETGLTSGTRCTVCGETVTAQETIPAKGHTWGDDDTCTKCGAEKPAENPPEHQHSYDDGAVTTPATCTENGVKTYTCSTCEDGTEGHTRTEEIEIDATAHPAGSIVDVEAVAATCTEDGLTAGTKCNACGEIVTAQETIPATGHKWEVDSTDSTKHVCSKCDVAAEGHTWGDDDTCIKCKAEKSGENPPEPPEHQHSYDDGAVTKEPTCTENGVKTYTCTSCEDGTEGHTRTEEIEIDATAHPAESIVDVEAVAATCTKKGSTAGKKCTACGTVTEGCTETDFADHVWGEGGKCQNCDATQCGETHTWGEPKFEDDKVMHECSVCHLKEEDKDHIHDYEWEVTTEAACTDEGVKTGTCACGKTTTETIPATGHTEETIPGKTATCTEDGLTDGVKCSVCGETITDQETIPATDHNYGEATVRQLPTGTADEDGNPIYITITERTCGNCGNVERTRN